MWEDKASPKTKSSQTGKQFPRSCGTGEYDLRGWQEMKFLINTMTPWDEPPRARHQVATALAEAHKVYFVCKNRTGKPHIEISQESENLTLISPFWPVDARIRYRLPGINEMYQNWLFRKLLRQYAKQYEKVIVINFDHTATQVFKYFKNVVYYCNDDHIGNARLSIPIINKYHNYCENKVIRSSKVCIGTSLYLKEKLMRLNSNSFLISLGAPDISVVEPPGLPFGSRNNIIRVGLVGFINSQKIPVELINTLLESGKVRITFIGPAKDEFKKKIKHRDKVIFKEAMVGEKLYGEIGKFDIGIAPYALEKCNRGVTPNKLWLYLAMGKPVVVTNLPNLRELGLHNGLVYKADSPSEFVELTVKAYENDNEDLFYERLKIARENTWERKVEEVVRLIKCHGDVD